MKLEACCMKFAIGLAALAAGACSAAPDDTTSASPEALGRAEQALSVELPVDLSTVVSIAGLVWTIDTGGTPLVILPDLACTGTAHLRILRRLQQPGAA